MIEAQILNQPPLSGTVDEVRFDAVGHCTWIRFLDNSYIEWCGIFGHGIGTINNDVSVNDAGQAFVIAKGQGFIVDVNSRNLLHKTEDDGLITVISIPECDIFVTCTYTYLYAYSPKGLLWESDKISVDGIKFIIADNRILKGQVWNLDDWVDFSLKIDGWEYQSEFACKF